MSNISAIPLNSKNGIASSRQFTSRRPEVIHVLTFPNEHTIYLPCRDSIYAEGGYPTWENTSEPPQNFGENIFTVKDKAHTIIDFYVDSLPVAEINDETYSVGDGTVVNPWRNLINAFYKLQCIYDNVLNSMCNDFYVYLHVSGTVDYTFNTRDWEEDGYYVLHTLPVYDRLILDFNGCTFNITERLVKSYYYNVLYPCYAVLNLTADISVDFVLDAAYAEGYALFGRKLELCMDTTLNITSIRNSESERGNVILSPKLAHTLTTRAYTDIEGMPARVYVGGAIINSQIDGGLMYSSALVKHSEIVKVHPFSVSGYPHTAYYDCIYVANGQEQSHLYGVPAHFYNCDVTLTQVTTNCYSYNSNIKSDSLIKLCDTSNNNKVTVTSDGTATYAVILEQDNHNNNIHCTLNCTADDYIMAVQLLVYSEALQVNNHVTCNANISHNNTKYSVLAYIVDVNFEGTYGPLDIQGLTVDVPTFNVSGDYYGIRACAIHVAPEYNVSMYNCNLWEGICRPGKGFDEAHAKCLETSSNCPEYCEDFECTI